MYTVKKVSLFNIPRLSEVSHILYLCGKDMADKYDLHHWDNSKFKTFLITVYCALKNKMYLVFDEKAPIATFQTKVIEDMLHFEKLAVSPEFSGKGVGSFCLERMEKIGKEKGCDKIGMEVYAPSRHAIEFYEHKGYKTVGEARTLKYSEYKMEKEIDI